MSFPMKSPLALIFEPVILPKFCNELDIVPAGVNSPTAYVVFVSS